MPRSRRTRRCESYTQPGATVNYGGVSLAADQGPCIYYYGNTGGALYYQSPNGTFTTPKLGTVKIAKAGDGQRLEGHAGRHELERLQGVGHDRPDRRSASWRAPPSSASSRSAKGTAKVILKAKGKTALKKGQTVKVAPVSQTATVTSTSNWDQRLVGKSVKL